MRFLVSTVFALAVLLAPLGQSEACAWFKFKNRTSKTLYVAFVKYDPACTGTPWQKKGWWKLAPGETKTAQGEAISNRYSYFYAESSDRTWTWSSGGPISCFPSPAFTWCWNICNNSPSTRHLGVRQVDTGSNSNFTVNLDPPAATDAASPGPGAADGTEDREPARADHQLPADDGSDSKIEAGAINSAAASPQSDPRDPMSDEPAESSSSGGSGFGKMQAVPEHRHPQGTTDPMDQHAPAHSETKRTSQRLP